MNTDALLGVVLRCLPTLVIFILAFIAASDAGTRTQWTNLLYQMGSIKPDQRNDPKVQGGVKLPFFVVAAVFLIWPIQYYRHANRTIEVKSDLYQRQITAPKVSNVARPTATPTPSGPPVPTPPPMPSMDGAPTSAGAAPSGAVQPGAAPAANPGGSKTNIYGTPIP
jgi:hypothetical protein